MPAFPDLYCVDDIECAAASVLPSGVWDFVAGGSGAETTLRANREAWQRIRLVPRILNDVAHIDLAVELLGHRAELPVAVAPMAYQRLLHPEGDLAAAAAARDAGIVYVASTLSSHPIEQIAAVGARTWFQLYWLRDRALMAELLQRAEDAGCAAIVLTVDVPRMGRRLRDIRNGFVVPDDVHAANLPADTQAAAHTRQPGRSAAITHTGIMFDPTLSWRDLSWLRERTSLPIILKGLLDPADARQAGRLGVSAVVVSNHGGRQLDGAVDSATALPAIRDALDDQVEVLVDSGIRSGQDVVRAIASGASAVLVGRPVMWGLAVDGQAGVRHVLGLLRAELADTLALAGCPDVAAARRLRVVHASR
ncbi:alpha-hydroxy-acid oxidizing protein [Kibdelosporangium aridum]|uniref:Alpha-hydroxy-acid oxidizing protein n=1 Tax=Kibdelosporangium aridum TaxID=2030 RepID=A0A428Z0M6_KIBAR|nr:alpha-hydroxy-acid oxidizing protein [Kibdelosporangium aridum]